MKPIAGVVLPPLSVPEQIALLPHVISDVRPHANIETPNPMYESGERQSFSLLPMNASRPLRKCCGASSTTVRTLNPSLLQLDCNDEPLISAFHALRPAVVCRNIPSAITLYSELAV